MKAEDIPEAVEVHGAVGHYADLIAHFDGGGVETITLGSEAEIEANSPALRAAIRKVLIEKLEKYIGELQGFGVQICDRDGLIKAAKDRRLQIMAR